jgi:hypothetical protein
MNHLPEVDKKNFADFTSENGESNLAIILCLIANHPFFQQISLMLSVTRPSTFSLTLKHHPNSFILINDLIQNALHTRVIKSLITYFGFIEHSKTALSAEFKECPASEAPNTFWTTVITFFKSC